MALTQNHIALYVYNERLTDSLENEGVPFLMGYNLCLVWPAIRAHAHANFIPGPVRGLLWSGIHEITPGIPQVKVAFFDGHDRKFGVLTVYSEVDDFELDFFDGIAWNHGTIDGLTFGFGVKLGTSKLLAQVLYSAHSKIIRTRLIKDGVGLQFS